MMRDINLFNKEEKWFKGNLHCHSTISDGRLSPEDIVKIYRESGWNFLAFAEHEILTNHSEFNSEDFLIIPAIEASAMKICSNKVFHVVGISSENVSTAKKPRFISRLINGAYRKINGVQAFINSWTKENNLAILAHPIWSKLKYKDIKCIKGYFAIEIFNFNCELENKTGICTEYWDALLRDGKRVLGVAVDDAHHRVNDRCGGWIMVKLPKLDIKSIAEALKKGRFYSSTGPEIYEYFIENKEVIIRSSQVIQINFITCKGKVANFKAKDGSTINFAKFKLKGYEKFVRVECVDKYDKVAWTNPIFL